MTPSLHTLHPSSLQELPTIGLEQRMALWAAADVACFTPLREGLNSYPLEAWPY